MNTTLSTQARRLAHTLAERTAVTATAIATAALAASGAAQAHPGHGDHDALGLLATLAHPLTLQQLPAVALAGAAVVVAGALLARAWPATRRPLALLLVAGATTAGLAVLARS
jgi:hypothetical protein